VSGGYYDDLLERFQIKVGKMTPAARLQFMVEWELMLQNALRLLAGFMLWVEAEAKAADWRRRNEFIDGGEREQALVEAIGPGKLRLEYR
jgi:hypothetical protein